MFRVVVPGRRGGTPHIAGMIFDIIFIAMAVVISIATIFAPL
jgi:hypothetical protein